MLKFANKIMALFVLCIVLIGVHILPLPAYAEEDYELARLKEQLQIGEAAELGLAARRDAELKKIFHEGLSQKQIEIKAEAVLETYRVESSKLVAKYRQPLMEHLQKKYPGLKDSVGTPLYAKDAKGNVVLDAQGRKVVHSDFRGWSGDHDMQGSATDVAKAKKYLNDNGFATTGFGSKELKDLTPGDLSNKSLELTINLNPTNQSIKDLLKTEALSPEVHSQLEADLARSQLSDSMLKAGDTAHQTVASVAARGKETYVSVSMQNGQPGLKAVLVNDHLKKAVEGLGMGGEDLLDMNNRDAFQGMIKGTDKAVRDGQLDAAVIEATLKKHQLDMSAADYQGLMTKLKVKPYPQIYGLDAAKMENLKNVNQELLDQSVTKTLKDAAVEVESHRKKVADLTAQINQATDPAEKQNLTAQREMLGREIVDTRVKLQEVLAANDERRQKYKLPPRPPVAEADSLKLTPETAPSSNHASLKAKSDLKKTARQGLAAAGQGMELYGYYSTAMQHAEEVVAESSPSDSDVMLIIEATKRGTMEAIGLNDAIEIQKENLPLMRDAMENIHKGNYFTGLYQWKAAMTLGMWELSKKQFNDMILTPLQDTGIAVYEGGRVVYDLLKDDVNITNNEAEQAQQQTAIAQKKLALDNLNQENSEQKSVAQDVAAITSQIPDPTVSQTLPDASAPVADTAPTIAESVPVQEVVAQNDLQIDPNAVAEERMVVTQEPSTDELTKEEVYRLVPADTIMAYSERLALAKQIQATGATGNNHLHIDPDAKAQERMITSPDPNQASYNVHTEPMIDGDAMEDVIESNRGSVDASIQGIEELCFGKDSSLAIRDNVTGYIHPGDPGVIFDSYLCGLKTKEGKNWYIGLGMNISSVRAHKYTVPVTICGRNFYTHQSDIENSARNWREVDKKHYEPMFTNQMMVVLLQVADERVSPNIIRNNGKKAALYKRIASCPATADSYDRLRNTGNH